MLLARTKWLQRFPMHEEFIQIIHKAFFTRSKVALGYL